MFVVRRLLRRSYLLAVARRLGVAAIVASTIAARLRRASRSELLVVPSRRPGRLAIAVVADRNEQRRSTLGQRGDRASSRRSPGRPARRSSTATIVVIVTAIIAAIFFGAASTGSGRGVTDIDLRVMTAERIEHIRGSPPWRRSGTSSTPTRATRTRRGCRSSERIKQMQHGGRSSARSSSRPRRSSRCVKGQQPHDRSASSSPATSSSQMEMTRRPGTSSRTRRRSPASSADQRRKRCREPQIERSDAADRPRAPSSRSRASRSRRARTSASSTARSRTSPARRRGEAGQAEAQGHGLDLRPRHAGRARLRAGRESIASVSSTAVDAQ